MNNLFRRVTAMILTLCMLLSMAPVGYATDDNASIQTEISSIDDANDSGIAAPSEGEQESTDSNVSTTDADELGDIIGGTEVISEDYVEVNSQALYSTESDYEKFKITDTTVSYGVFVDFLINILECDQNIVSNSRIKIKACFDGAEEVTLESNGTVTFSEGIYQVSFEYYFPVESSYFEVVVLSNDILSLEYNTSTTTDICIISDDETIALQSGENIVTANQIYTIRLLRKEGYTHSVSYEGENISLTLDQDDPSYYTGTFIPAQSGTLLVSLVEANSLYSVALSSNCTDYGSTFFGKSTSTEFSFLPGDSVTITACPENGCTFYGWKKTTGGVSELIPYDAATDNRTMQIEVTDNVTYTALFEKPGEDELIFRAGDNDANVFLGSQGGEAMAFASGLTDKMVYVIKSGTVTEDFTIPSGVTLLLPYSDDDLTISTNSDYLHANMLDCVNADTLVKAGEQVKYCITIPNGVKVTCAEQDDGDSFGGRIVVGSKISYCDAHKLYSGQTCGAHSEILLNGEIELNTGAVLSSCGYITGDGKITSYGASIYEPFVINDMYGGSYMAVCYDNDTAPFNCYSLPNIQCDMEISDCGQLLGYVNLHVNSASQKATMRLVAPSDGILETNENTVVEYSYEPTNKSGVFGTRDYMGRSIFNIYNGGKVGSMSLSISLNGVNIAIDTKNIGLPVSYNVEMHLHNGDYSLDHMAKYNPGAELYVEEDATFTINGSLFIYNGTEFLCYNSKSDDLHGAPSNSVLYSYGYPQRGRMVVNGKLIINGSFAGIIESEKTGAEITVGDNATLNITYREGAIKDQQYNGLGNKTSVTTMTKTVLDAEILNPATGIIEKLLPGTTYKSYKDSTTTLSSYQYYKYDWDSTDTEQVPALTTVSYENPETVSGGWSTKQTLNLYYGNSIIHTVSAYIGETLSGIPTEHSNLPISKWVDDDGNAYDLTAMPAGVKKLTAVLGKETTVNFEPNGGTGATQTITYTLEQGVLPQCYEGWSKTGYQFAGWGNGATGSTTVYQAGATVYVSSLTTLYAQWTPITYTVHFDGNGADGGSMADATWNYDQVYSVTNGYTRNGYTFAGWNTKADGTGTGYSTSASISNLTTEAGATVTLYAQWTPITYTVQFSAGEDATGNAMTQSFTYGIAQNLKAFSDINYTKTGHSFAGWKDSDGKTYTDQQKVSNLTSVQGATVYLTAQWTPNQYTMTFRSDGETYATIKQGYGTDVTAPANPTKTGYTFNGWDTAVPATMPDKDTTYIATWSINQYTITFADTGDTTIAPITQNYNTAITAPATPTKTGYTFNGWDKEIPSTMPAEDMTITAQWMPNTYNIHFYDGETLFKTVKTTFGSTISAPEAPEKTGYAFTGWVDAQGNQIPKTLTTAKDQNYYASYEANNVTFALNADGGTVSDGSASVTATYGQAIGTLPTATKIGYEFLGWYIGETVITANTEVTLTSGTLTAKWEMIEYSISYNNYYGFAQDAEKWTSYTIESKDYTLPTPIRTGYAFAGWTNEAGEPVTVLKQGTTGHQTFIATWTPIEYTITFNTDGGSEIAEIKGYYGGTVTTPTDPTKTGHTFNGWDAEIPATMPAENVTITAQWTVNPYTITFDTAGGSTVEPITQDYGTAITAPADPTKTGYTFTGWDKTIPATMPAENMTITAQWAVNRYTISFDTAGGSTVEPITQDYDTVITAPENPERESHTFLGWDMTIPDTMPAGDITITAKWAQNVTVTLLWGYQEATTESAYVGQRYSVASAVTKRDGYTFAGWFTEDGVQVTAENPLTIEGAVTLTAKWTEIKNSITYELDGGTLPDEAPTGYSGAVEVALINPTKTGHTFLGWTGSNGNDPQKEVTIAIGTTGDLTYTANWQKNSYTLTFMDGETVVKTEGVPYGRNISVPDDPTKTGYIFTGWNETVPETMPAKDLTFNATWKPITYRVKFASGGGEGEMNDLTLTYDQEYTLTKNSFTKTGHTFKNWNVSGTDTYCEDGAAVTNLAETQGAEVTLVAMWSSNEYTVSFNLGYSTTETIPSRTVYYNGDYGTLPVPAERTGYTFAGWYTSTEYTDLVTETTVFGETANKTLYAKWDVNSYILTFKNGEETVKSESVAYGSVITTPTAPQKEGYTFSGWEGYNAGMTMPAQDLTLAAIWEVNQYTITFNTDGGSTVAAITQDYGSDITAPADSTKVGYTFAGWDVEIPETMPAKNVTITATWTINQYTITFDTDGGSAIAAITQDYNTEVTAPEDPEKTGYTFVGWSPAIPNTMPGKNVTVTAQWTVNQYTITFDTDGGSTVQPITQDYNTTVTAPEDPTRTGYTFAGWDIKIPETMPAENLKVTARWKINSYTITFDSAGGTAVEAITADYGETVRAPEDPTREGYTFASWSPVLPGTMPAENLKVTAQWDINSYTITYKNGDDVVDIQTYAYGADVTATTVATSKEGHTFAGWLDVPDTMPAQNLEVQAEWTVNSYLLTYVPNFGTFNGETEITYAYGTKITKPKDPTRTGYTFLGWYANGTAFDFDTMTMPAAEFYLTALWQVNQYTITFDSTGGTDVASITQDYNTAVTEPDEPTREGYTFAGWFTGANGTGDRYFSGSTLYMPLNGLNLYAKWDVQAYTVTLDPTEDGTVSTSTVYANYNTTVDVTGYQPTKVGYLFQGWYLGDTQYTTFIMPAGGITLTAKYTSYLDLLCNLGADDIAANESTLLLAREYYSKLNEAQKTAYKQNEVYQTHREAFFEAIRVYSVEKLEQSVIDAVEPTNKILKNHGIEGITGPIAELSLQGRHLEGILLEEDCLAMNLLGVNFLEKLFEYKEIKEIQIEDTVVTNIAQLDIMLAVAYATLAEDGQTMDQFMNYLMNDEIQYSMTVGDMDGTSADAIITGETVEGVRYSLDYSFFFFNQTHTVRWNDGTTVTDQLYDYQEEICFNDAVSKTGYTVSGWKDASGKEVTFPVSMGKTDVEYYAVWTPNEYDVKLNYCDGRENETVTVTYGDYYYDYLPKTASRDGYTFKGWYSEPDGKGIYYNADVKVETTEIITVYAFWGANEFSITFDSNGGSPVTNIYQQCDTPVSAPADPTLAGYDFVGWYLGEKPYTFTTMPAANITLTAKWTPKTYTVTFLDDDGVTVLDSITAKYGEAITAPSDPVRTGYTFIGWNTTVPETMPLDGANITARWEKNRHTITYDTQGGTAVNAVTLSYGTEIPIPEEPTKVGYTFLGWDQEIPKTMPDEDLTIKALWQVNSYELSFDSDGGSPVESMQVEYGAAVVSPADPTRIGHTFRGWEPALPATMPANHVAVKALWKADTYQVTLDFADGVTEKETITVTYNETYKDLPVPARDGYDFVGWFDGEQQVNTTTVVPVLTEQTLVAKWNESGDTPYKVEHYQQALDGTYTLADTTEHTGVTGSTVQVSRQSYTGFHANSEQSDATGVIAADGSLVMKVYYDRNTYTITWKVRGTTVTESLVYGATPEYVDTAWEDDIHYTYTFTGWDQEIKAVTGDTIYTAQYDKTYEASIGTVTYKTLKLAIDHAVSGNVVRIDSDVTLAADLTVPAGVTLLIPCVDDDAGYNVRDNGRMPFNHDGVTYKNKTGLDANAKLYKSLTIPEGVTLNVKGTVLINSVSGRRGTTYYDHDITGGYGQINLDGNIVVENGGQLDCFGYIKGDGLVTAKNGGGVGDLYIVRNWRGGTQGLDMYQQDIYPINEYDCHNIETDLRLEYGANLVGMVKMFANAGDGGKYYYTRFPQVDNTNGLIRLTTEDSYLIRKYVDGVEKFYIYGGANFGSSALTLLGMSLSTAMMTYPTDGDITYDLYDGAYHYIYTENNGNWANGFKLLTGSSLTIHDGASLTVDPGVTLSVYETFVDGTKDSTKYPDRPAAYIQVEEGGKFINAGSFGGIIKTDSPDILIGDYPNWGTTTDETAAFTGDTDKVQTLEHDLQIFREGYSWKYGDDLSIIWIGADYTAVEAALNCVPENLYGYSKAARSAVEAAVEAVVYDLPKTRQADVDAMAKAISDAVKNLKWAVIRVSFDANGGSAVTTTLTRTFGTVYGALPVTSLKGYEFVGWYTALTGGQLITADTKVNFDEDITLYAKWRDASFTAPADYAALNAAIAAVPTDVAGYTNGSVAAMREAVNKVEYGLTVDRQEDVDAWTAAIYAAIRGLTPKTITITFDPGEGRASFLTKSVTYLSSFGELPTANREFYSFVGWFTDEVGGSEITADTVAKFTENATLYAHYVQEDGDYTLVNRYLSLIEEAGDLSIYSDDSVEKINAAVAGVVMGLGAEDQDQIDQMAQALRKAWNGKTLRRVLVSLKPNGGSCSVAMKQYRYGDPYSDLPAATREGYTFLGWFTSEAGGTLVDGSVIMKQIVNHSLYAHWKWNGADYSKVDAALVRVPTDLAPYTIETKRALQNAINAVEYELGAEEQSKVDGWAEAIDKAIDGLVKKTLTITFDPNGGTVTPATKTVSYGGTVVMPVPARSGYRFGGWYTAKSGGERYTDTTAVTSNVTVFAHWTMISADYTEVNKAISQIPADLSIYTEESVATLNAAKNAVKYDLSSGEQSTVNGWAAAIRNAISGLVRKLPFVDVKEGDWFYGYVSDLYYAAIINGTGDGTTYSPNMVTDRAQMAVLLYRISGSPASSGTHPFTDVPKNAYFYDAVCWAYENGVVNGTGDGSTFSPYMGITREMFATMLYRLYDSPKVGGNLSRFPDGKSVSDWAMDGMNWAVQVGIITGKGDGTLAPQAQATRAEVATMLKRYRDLIQ